MVEPLRVPRLTPEARRDGAMTTIERIEIGRIPLLARPYYDGGDPGPIVAALAQVPELLVAAMPFIGTVLGRASAP